MEIEEEKTHLLSDEIKWAIVQYKKKGLSNTATASAVAREHNRPTLSHQTVKKVWTKYEAQKNVDNNWNENGRPLVISAREERRILEFVSMNRNASVSDI